MSDSVTLSQFLWSADPATRRALWTILALVVPIAGAVYVPLMARAVRFFLLERRLRDTLEEYESKGPAAQRGALREWVRDSPLRGQFDEFEQRWTTAQLTEGGGRAPIRLLDILEDRPLLPFGPRRSLLPVLPGLFLGIGVFGALFGLIPSIGSLDGSATGSGAVDPLATALGLALRATAWGFAAAISASLAGRLVEGGFDARSRGLDDVLAHAYQAVSPGELAEITRQTQQKTIETLGRVLTQFAHELNERLERGLQRIEQSSARAASLVSQEQRGALHTVVQELALSVRQGVDHHLAELRTALQRAVDYQSSVTNGLSETYERMVENAQMQDRVARTLGESANALDVAARLLRSETSALAPGTAPAGASDEVARAGLGVLRESEALAARIAEEIGEALRGFTEQVRQIDRTMEALRLGLDDEGRAREGAAGDPGQRSRPDRSPAPRERSRAPATGERHVAATPSPRPAEPPGPASAPIPALAAAAATPARAPAPASARTAPPAAATSSGTAPLAAQTRATSSPAPASPAPAPERAGIADVAATDGPIGRELSLSGFRVGAPRAQGPDPYERLASGNEPPSNVRPFPTRERELGDELKLSGLLGPSAPPGSGPARARRRILADEEETDAEHTTAPEED